LIVYNFTSSFFAYLPTATAWEELAALALPCPTTFAELAELLLAKPPPPPGWLSAEDEADEEADELLPPPPPIGLLKELKPTGDKLTGTGATASGWG
jgi:hypothetical protein